MTTTDPAPAFAAHIVTAEATGYGDPAITVMTTPDEAGTTDVVAEYPLTTDADPATVLDNAGWRFVTDDSIRTDVDVDRGYSIRDVEPLDWRSIVRHVTFAHAQADAEKARQEAAWRGVIREAVISGESPTELASDAGISRARVYQIRDRRR